MLASDWQNPVDALDVSGDRHISPIDALLVINEINVHGSRALLGSGGEDALLFFDVSGDSFCSPIDVLLVINALNEKRVSPYTLSESSGPGSEQAVRIGLGQDHGSRLYRFAIDACFDRSDTSARRKIVWRYICWIPRLPRERCSTAVGRERPCS